MGTLHIDLHTTRNTYRHEYAWKVSPARSATTLQVPQSTIGCSWPAPPMGVLGFEIEMHDMMRLMGGFGTVRHGDLTAK